MYVGAIDQGTSSTRFIFFNENGEMMPHSHQMEFTQIRTQPGWLEHDPLEILDTVQTCIDRVMKHYKASEVVSVGITNQRETVVAWDRKTGKALYNAIVWSDCRTSCIAEEFKKLLGVDYFRKSCGLPINTYFSALKMVWLMRNVPKVSEAIEKGTCIMGTMESWLIWNLTGGVNGGKLVSDVTNASRTMLMNLNTQDWDPASCKAFGIPINCLAPITSNCEQHGLFVSGPLRDVLIGGSIGDQQGATLGQLCFEQGTCKSTYGTGGFLIFNTGSTAIHSKHNLLTTTCFKLGKDATLFFGLEGSISSAGSTVRWLRDQLQIITKASELDEIASKSKDNGGIVFVNAFSGLYAPYWRSDVRGTIFGISDSTDRSHICRAVIEAVSYRTREVVEAMLDDVGDTNAIKHLRVDGGMADSDLLLQCLSDQLGVEIHCPAMKETSALGAAITAGITAGFWKSPEDVVSRFKGTYSIKTPHQTREDSSKLFSNWKKAVFHAIAHTESPSPWISSHWVPFSAGMFAGILVSLAFWKTILKTKNY